MERERTPLDQCRGLCRDCNPNCPLIIAEVKAIVVHVTGIPDRTSVKSAPQTPDNPLSSAEEEIKVDPLDIDPCMGPYPPEGRKGYDWIFRL